MHIFLPRVRKRGHLTLVHFVVTGCRNYPRSDMPEELLDVPLDPMLDTVFYHDYNREPKPAELRQFGAKIRGKDLLFTVASVRILVAEGHLTLELISNRYRSSIKSRSTYVQACDVQRRDQTAFSHPALLDKMPVILALTTRRKPGPPLDWGRPLA